MDRLARTRSPSCPQDCSRRAPRGPGGPIPRGRDPRPVRFPARSALPALRDAAKADPALGGHVREIEAARHPALLAPALAADTAPGRYVVRVETTQGDIDVEVHRDWAPLAADRFYNLVRIGFFDGVRFFRVVPGFVAQFGKSADPEVNKRWYQSTLKDEPVAESNKRGYLSFAKMPQPDTRSTQVFINLADNPDLDKQGFSAFDRVLKGVEVVDRLYSGYGEKPDQGHLHYKGDDYLKQNFPKARPDQGRDGPRVTRKVAPNVYGEVRYPVPILENDR